MLGMLRKDRFEISRESHVVATENSYSDNEAEALGFVVREVEDSEELHPVLGDCVLFLHDIDMPEEEQFVNELSSGE